MISFELKNIYPFLNEKDLEGSLTRTGKSLKLLHSGTGRGSDYLGWLNLPEKTDKRFLDAIDGLADEFQNETELLVVIGIGGSYIGSRAIGDALNHNFSNFLSNDKPQLIFAGQNLSQDYLYELLEVLENKSYGIVVISKSGTTTEPALAFRILKQQKNLPLSNPFLISFALFPLKANQKQIAYLAGSALKITTVPVISSTSIFFVSKLLFFINFILIFHQILL